MLPISGPFTVNREMLMDPWFNGANTGGAGCYLAMNRRWYRQKRPYDRPLAFEFNKRETLSVRSSGIYGPYTLFLANANPVAYRAYFLSQGDVWAGPVADCKNAARAKFNQKVTESASWMVSLAQHRQTMDMMENRLFQFIRFTKALRRLDFHAAYDSLRSTHTREGMKQKFWTKAQNIERRGTAKSFGNTFLEFHFGWESLWKDIQSTIKALTGPIPYGRVSARASVSAMEQVYDPADSNIWGKHRLRVDVRCGANIKVENPNLFLANQLGLINPLPVLWDIIPWSFVVGWFANFEQCLSEFSEFYGLSVDQPYYTITGHDDCLGHHTAYPPGGGFWYNDGHQRATSVQRVTGSLPEITFRVKPFRLSPTRAATAAALLLQELAPGYPSKTRVNPRVKRWPRDPWYGN